MIIPVRKRIRGGEPIRNVVVFGIQTKRRGAVEPFPDRDRRVGGLPGRARKFLHTPSGSNARACVFNDRSSFCGADKINLDLFALNVIDLILTVVTATGNKIPCAAFRRA